MASLKMGGPFKFTRGECNARIEKISPGNYALGKIHPTQKNFIVQYVGRADIDLNDRIKEHLAEGYSHFKYSYANTPKEAFAKECTNYHDFGEDKKLHNKAHPSKPVEDNCKCPVCNC